MGILQTFRAKALGAFALLCFALPHVILAQNSAVSLNHTPPDQSHDHMVLPAIIEEVEALGIVKDCQDTPAESICFPSELLRLHFRPTFAFVQSNKIDNLTLDQPMTTRPDQSGIVLILARRVAEQGDKGEEWEIVSYAPALLKACFPAQELDESENIAGLSELVDEGELDEYCFGSYLSKGQSSD